MRILLISHEYPPYMFGGVGTFTHHLSRGLADRGVDVTVVSMKFSRKFSNKFDVEEHGSRLRIIRIPTPTYLYPRHEVFQMVARPLISELSKESDILHTNSGLYYPFLRNTIKNCGKPAVITVHNDHTVAYKASLNLDTSFNERAYGLLHMSEGHMALRRELKELYPVFVSKSLYDTMKSKYVVRSYEIIYNGLDFVYIDRAVSSHPKTKYYEVIKGVKGHDYKVLVYNARHYPIKNHLTLIKTFRHLLRKCGTRFLLVLTSDGISTSAISRLIKELNISKNVVMTGKLPYDETLRILSLADAVPYVSLYEAHPLALVEALYLGKSVVVFNLPYAREIAELCLSHGYSCDIRLVNSANKFIEELCNIMTSSTSKDRKIIIDEFSVSNMVDRYIRLYKRLLS